MTSHEEAFTKVKVALDKTVPGISEKVTLDTHLVEDEILDSLDIMNFMFELEDLHGSKIEEVTDTFDDFRLSVLVGFMVSA